MPTATTPLARPVRFGAPSLRAERYSVNARTSAMAPMIMPPHQ